MSRIYLFSTICLFFQFISCNQKTKETDIIFKNVIRIVETAPDSALILLDSIQYPQKLATEQYNQYLLLRIQAKDKAYKDIASDSLIFNVREFFYEKKDFEKAALAAYYCGRVYQSRCDSENAMKAYLDAKIYVMQTEDACLKGLIEFSIGKLFYQKYLYDEAIERYQVANDYFHKLGNKYSNEISTLLEIGNCYLLKECVDSAFYYYKESLSIAAQQNDSAKQALIKQNMGVAYCQINEYDKARESFRQAISLNLDKKEQTKLYINLAKLYDELGLKDSTQYYVNLSLQALEKNKDNKVLANMYSLLSKLEEKNQNYRKALEFNRQYNFYLSEIVEEKQNQEILEVQKKYKSEFFQNKANELLIERQFVLLIALVLFIGILIISFVFYRKNARNREDILDANQKINQLNESAKSYDANKSTFRNTLIQRFDILKKAALLEGYLRDEDRENGKDLLNKFNEVVYGQKVGFDWNLLYQSINELHDGFLDRLYSTFPQLNENEFRICCLSYAGLNNTEIAIIMKLSFNTIQVKKSVIRKKIGANGHGSLIEFLNQRINE